MSTANQLKAMLPVENQGLKEIERYTGMNLPEEYEITEVLGDIIMAEYVDTDESGDYVDRGGIFVDTNMSKNTWRVAEIILHGAGCSDIIEKGKCIMFPDDKGIPAVNKSGKPRIFLNESRIFGICEHKPGEQ